jgi:hypothetical protein
VADFEHESAAAALAHDDARLLIDRDEALTVTLGAGCAVATLYLFERDWGVRDCCARG